MMPSFYEYVCVSCGHREERYRNVKRCRKCGGYVHRVEVERVSISVLQAANKELRSTLETREAALRRAEDALDSVLGAVRSRYGCMDAGCSKTCPLTLVCYYSPACAAVDSVL